MIFLAKCTFTLGRVTKDKDGNTIHETPAKCEIDPEGGSVAVGVLDDDTLEQVGEAELYGDFDPWGYLSCALKLLAPKRAGNIPNFESIFREMAAQHGNEDCPLLDWCHKGICAYCIVHQWLEDDESP